MPNCIVATIFDIFVLFQMEFVPYNTYPYQYNPYNDTTYYYYEPPMVEMVDSMGMMSMSPMSSGSMSPTSHVYIPDQNNNTSNNTAVLTPEGEYEYPDQQQPDYNKLNNQFILNTDTAFIIVDPEYPFIDLPYIHNGKQSFNNSGKKGPKGGFKKQGGFKAYKDFNKDKLEDTEESTVKLVPPEISYNRDELMNIAKMPLSQATPDAWPSIAKKLPRLVRREGPTANIIIKEIRAVKKQEELNVAKMTIKNEPEPQILSL